MIHDTQSAQISQKQNEQNIYVIVKTMYPPVITTMQWLCGNSCNWAHDVRFNIRFCYDVRFIKRPPCHLIINGIHAIYFFISKIF